MTDLERADEILSSENCTCVLCRGDKVFTSRKRGIAPLLELIDAGEDLSGFSASDRVVGAGAAFIYAYCGINCVHAAVMSEKSLPVLERAGIAASYDSLVPGIINRAGDGPCPMEAAVEGETDPGKALEKLRETVSRLKSGN